MEQETSSPPIEAVKRRSGYCRFFFTYFQMVYGKLLQLLFSQPLAGLRKWLSMPWNKSRLPFKQDRDRYRAVMSAVDPSHLYYFRDPEFSCVFKRRLDGFDEAAHQLTEIHLPAYLNKTLKKKETDLVEKMGALANHLSRKFFPCHGNQNAFTMYWDTFDEWNDEDQRRATEIQSEIGEKLKEAIEAYEAFRDYGNRLFADRLVKEKSDG